MQNERCEIFMNETKFEDDVIKEKKLILNFQTKGAQIPKIDEEKIKFFLKTILVATPFWGKCEVATHTTKNGTWESPKTLENSEHNCRGQNTLH
jgi:hypothetical protein